MKQNNNKNNYPKYLSDVPVNKPSEVANTIAEEILSNTKKNRIIGLLGSWGSGKSSTVENIKEKLNDYCEIFEYDAWENEKFPFKLGFLKKIIKDIKNKNNDDNVKKLEQKLKDLEQLNETQEAKEYAFINFENLLIAIPLLFYPFAFNLLDTSYKFLYINNVVNYFSFSYFKLAGIYYLIFSLLYFTNSILSRKTTSSKTNLKNLITKFLIDFHSSANKKVFLVHTFGIFLNIVISVILISFITNLTILIILLPFIIWLLFNFDKFLLKCIDPKNDFYILSGTTPEVRSLITINKSLEPNLIEFQNLYQEILECNDKAKCKPSVIIIDNIDRIDIEEAKKIWATLKGMILKNISNCIYSNIIIPVDEEQILKLYEDNSSETSGIDNKSASFVQKTFDMTFRISPFIMDNVKSFLYEKLDEAFGRNFFNDEERLSILNIFNSRNFGKQNKDFIVSSYAGQATPRKIIKMINEVVSIHKNNTFCEIPIVVKFAYILHYNNINGKLQNKIIKGLLPNDSLTLINIEENDQAKLISLYYGVPELKALKIAKKEDLIDKLYSSEFLITEDIKSIEDIWNIIFEIANESLYDKPYSVLTIFLQNVMFLQDEIPSNNFVVLLKNIMDLIVKQNRIDNYNNLHSETICKAITLSDNLYIPKILSLAFKFYEKDDFSDNESKEWLNFVKAIINHFNIKKDSIYKYVQYIPESLYTKVVGLLDENDYKLLDSYIMEVQDFEKIINNNDIMFNNIKFIINAPPLDEYRTEWIDKINKLVSVLEKLLNEQPTNVIDLLYKFILVLKDSNSSLCDYIKSEEYFLKVLNQIYKDTQLLARGFAINAYIDPSLSVSYNYSIKNPSLSNWKIVFNNNSEDFIREFTTTYINLNSDLLSVFDISTRLQTLQQVINFVVENIDNFNLDIDKFFPTFNKFNEDKRDVFFNKFMQYQKAKSLLENLKFNDNNKELLYYLSSNIKSLKYIKKNAEEYLQNIKEEQWENEAKNCSINFKIAFNIKSQNIYFKNILSKLSNTIVVIGIAKFIDIMSKELNIVKEYDKTYGFINDILDHDLKAINGDIEILIDNFEQSVINWLNKTSHNNYTIYTDFIRKINNANWIVKNKLLLSKFIDSDEIKQNFVGNWENNDEVKNAYYEIFQYVHELNSKIESE